VTLWLCSCPYLTWKPKVALFHFISLPSTYYPLIAITLVLLTQRYIIYSLAISLYVWKVKKFSSKNREIVHIENSKEKKETLYCGDDHCATHPCVAFRACPYIQGRRYTRKSPWCISPEHRTLWAKIMHHWCTFINLTWCIGSIKLTSNAQYSFYRDMYQGQPTQLRPCIYPDLVFCLAFFLVFQFVFCFFWLNIFQITTFKNMNIFKLWNFKI
jgi:hypothetical protein